MHIFSVAQCIDTNHFQCDSGQCVFGECNGYPDCEDGSDEFQHYCGKYNIEPGIPFSDLSTRHCNSCMYMYTVYPSTLGYMAAMATLLF